MPRNRFIHWDRRLYLVSHRKLRASWANGPMIFVTQCGTKGAVWVCIAVVLFAFGGSTGRAAATVSFCALLVAETVINLVLKPAISRDRPYARRGPGRVKFLLIRAPDPHSWPSGHAGSSWAAAVPLAIAYPAAAIVFLAMATAVAYSRVYVGVHYPLDVAAGALVGVASAIVTLTLWSVLSHIGVLPTDIFGVHRIY